MQRTRDTDRRLQLVDISGQPVDLSFHDYCALFRRRSMQTFLLLILLVLITTDPPGLWGRFSAGVILAFWALSMALFFVLLTGAAFALDEARRRGFRATVPLPLLTLPCMLLSVLTGEAAMLTADQSVHAANPAWHLLMYPVVSEVFSLIFVRYVLPALQKEIRVPHGPAIAGPDSAWPPAPPVTRKILIGTDSIPLTRLHHIEAREHHVHVTLDGKSVTHRARLRDIVAQTSAEDGVQPHRSWWVARGAALRLSEDGGRPVLITRDGQRIPVAKARVPVVRDWLERQKTG